MKALKISMAVLCATLFASCGTAKKTVKQPEVQTIPVHLVCTAAPDTHYRNLTHGLEIFVSSDATERAIFDTSELPSASREYIANYWRISVDPPIKEFVANSMALYARSSGIEVGGNVNTDFRLRVSVRSFKITLGANTGGRGVVELEYTLTNPDNETLLRQTVRGRYVAPSVNTDAATILDRAFTDALKAMNWDGIAGYLGTPRHAEQQPTTQVKGDGNTALEHTIIRWNVESRPAGADVYWRVVSSTPEVKNTNASYLGTTPYESTESFDIRGLSYENAGNIQIEIKCERPGYLPQTRRFNLRQVIDQKEISTKFNLVKDED